jgi:Uma2 family endonuclease
MGVPVIDTGPMTVDDFYAFTDTRPDEEKWELIDGEPILNASPAILHQQILANILYVLAREQREWQLSWTAIPGIGALISDISRPEPDVMVLPKRLSSGDRLQRHTGDAIVLFEIMSPSTSGRDLKWKRAAYAAMPALTHYVVVAQDSVEVAVFARRVGFDEQRLRSLGDVLELDSLGVSLPLDEIYRDTGLQ